MSAAQGMPAQQPPAGTAATGAATGTPAVGASAAGTPELSRNYWLVTVIRAIPALIVGLVITFLQDHSAQVGLLAFGGFAAVGGLVVLIGAIRHLSDRVVRGVLLAQGVIASASGITALVLWNAGVAVLLLIVTLYAALTGALETYAGLRSRGSLPSRDWLTVGVYTAIAAIVFVLIPPDPILTTGLIGAYAAILGVFLLIAGFSQKWANDKPSGAQKLDEGKATE